MIRGLPLFSVVCVAVSLLAMPAAGESGYCRTRWYGDHERGWFWYEVEPEPPKEEEPVLWEPVPEPPARVEPAPPELPVLSAAWIREYFEKFQMRAIDDPTPENVAAFLYIQRVMLDKSQRFAQQVANVVRGDPYLDQNTRRPLATFGTNLFAREALAAREELLAQVARKAGIFFFFQGACKQCEIQAPVLRALQDRYGFVIMPVSVDGGPLANGLYPDFAPDRGQARSLGVVQTPAMFLGRPAGREIIPLGQSTLSREQLEQHILAAAKEAGWITPEEFNRAQGMDSTLALNLTPEAMPVGLSETEVVEYIKSLYQELGRNEAKN